MLELMCIEEKTKKLTQYTNTSKLFEDTRFDLSLRDPLLRTNKKGLVIVQS